MNRHSQIDEVVPLPNSGDGYVDFGCCNGDGRGEYDILHNSVSGDGLGQGMGDGDNPTLRWVSFTEFSPVPLASTDSDLWICWDTEQELG